MDKKLRRRIIPAVAFKLTIVSFALALTTLLAGITGNNPKSATILTFNTSSLGLQDYYDLASPLHSNVTALVPSDVTNPPSITQYLGTHDWYSMHYFTNCSGFFAPSTSNPSLLTANKINVTCKRQISGYIFKLHDVIESQLLPGVKGLASDVSTAQYMTSTWSSLWYAGIGNTVVTAYTLPWNFAGQRPWLNMWVFWDSFVSAVLLLASSAMVTNTVITVQHAKGLPGPNPGSATFLGIMWSTTALMAVVCGLMWMQWNLEGRYRECCGEESETRVHGDARPVEEWKSEKTFVEGQKS